MTRLLSSVTPLSKRLPALPRAGADPGTKAALPPAGEWVLSLLLAFGLAHSRLGPFCAPFALGLTAGAGGGARGLWALTGACGGYLTSMGLVTGLRYTAAALLIYALCFAFWESKVCEKFWFMPAGGAAVNLLTGLMALSSPRSGALSWQGLPLETGLVFTSTLLFQALRPEADKALPRAAREISLLGLWAALGPAAGRWLSVSPWLSTGITMALGAGLILLRRRKAAPRARDRPGQEEQLSGQESLSGSYARRQLGSKLAGQAKAFQTLSEDMRKGLSQNRPSQTRLEQVFDRAAEQVCQDCIRYPLCWKQDYHETYQAFRQMLEATRERGYGKLTDAPKYFQSRCGRGTELVAAANVEYASLLHRRQLEARLSASRAAVWQQYSQLAQLLDQAARELEDELSPEPEHTLPVLRFLRRHGLEAGVRMGRDRRGRLVIQLSGEDLSLMEQGRLFPDLCSNMGMDFARSPIQRDRQGQHMTLVQEDTLQATAGVAALARDGQTVSGDGGNWFRDRDGWLWVVLCDGMGSGPGAAAQSRLALRLLEDFLRSGVSAELALSTISGALALRGEQELGFTTIDLLGLDLFSGSCRSYKLGGGPTYLRQQGRVKKISGSSLPAGLDFGRESRPDVRSFQIAGEDLIILLSDGITDGVGDDWIWQLIRDFHGQSPRELAHAILEAGKGGGDDRTVIVLQIRKRPLTAGERTGEGVRAAGKKNVLSREKAG